MHFCTGNPFEYWASKFILLHLIFFSHFFYLIQVRSSLTAKQFHILRMNLLFLVINLFLTYIISRHIYVDIYNIHALKSYVCMSAVMLFI